MPRYYRGYPGDILPAPRNFQRGAVQKSNALPLYPLHLHDGSSIRQCFYLVYSFVIASIWSIRSFYLIVPSFEAFRSVILSCHCPLELRLVHSFYNLHFKHHVSFHSFRCRHPLLFCQRPAGNHFIDFIEFVGNNYWSGNGACENPWIEKQK